MLFWAKRRALGSLLALAVLLGLAAALGFLLDIRPDLAVSRAELEMAAIGLAAIAFSDALVHGGLFALLGKRYLDRYRALAGYFDGQGAAGAAAGGATAATEELLFRGVLFEAIANGAGLGPAAAIAATSVAFALAHLVPRRDLAPFAIWAAWESVLLGLVRSVSGSVAAAAIAHALHDTGGFLIFAIERHRAASAA